MRAEFSDSLPNDLCLLKCEIHFLLDELALAVVTM